MQYRFFSFSFFLLTLGVFTAHAQPPEQLGNSRAAADRFVARMMSFDKNGDGKLTKEEITDSRLVRLFERADANHDGVVTKEELVALFNQEGQSRRGFGPPGGRGFGGPPFGRPPTPGELLPGFVKDQLELTAEQAKQFADLQKDVLTKLDKILTAEQKQQLKNMTRP